MVAPSNLTCSLHMNNLNAPRRPGVLQAVSLTDEFRVLTGCAPKRRLIIALKRGRYMMVIYETMGVNDIPIP
jgi:hypothetical protein